MFACLRCIEVVACRLNVCRVQGGPQTCDLCQGVGGAKCFGCGATGRMEVRIRPCNSASDTTLAGHAASCIYGAHDMCQTAVHGTTCLLALLKRRPNAGMLFIGQDSWNTLRPVIIMLT